MNNKLHYQVKRENKAIIDQGYYCPDCKKYLKAETCNCIQDTVDKDKKKVKKIKDSTGGN